MTERFDDIVIGLGALGSAAAHQLARRGRRVLGLERFELGHARGASHDTSRILRHSYHTPGYVRLTEEAYDDWARLEEWSGETLVSVVGGLDLFPPDAAIPMADYTDSPHAPSGSTSRCSTTPRPRPGGRSSPCLPGPSGSSRTAAPSCRRAAARRSCSAWPSRPGPTCATAPGCSRSRTGAPRGSRS